LYHTSSLEVYRNSLKINSPIQYGNLENYQSAIDNYNEDSNKEAINTPAELSIKKLDSHIVMDPVVGTKGDKVQINASLINNQSGKGIPRQEISFYAPDGKIIGEAKTNDDGKVTCNYIITQTPDKYSLKAFLQWINLLLSNRCYNFLRSQQMEFNNPC
jgi:acylphosphatase